MFISVVTGDIADNGLRRFISTQEVQVCYKRYVNNTNEMSVHFNNTSSADEMMTRYDIFIIALDLQRLILL